MSYTTIQLSPGPADPLAELQVSSAGAAGVLVALLGPYGERLRAFGLTADKARELAAELLAQADAAEQGKDDQDEGVPY